MHLNFLACCYSSGPGRFGSAVLRLAPHPAALVGPKPLLLDLRLPAEVGWGKGEGGRGEEAMICVLAVAVGGRHPRMWQRGVSMLLIGQTHQEYRQFRDD